MWYPTLLIMKKILFLTAFFAFFPTSFAATEVSPAAQKILEYAHDRISYFHDRQMELEQDSTLSRNFCYEKGGWETEMTFLGNLGLAQIYRSKELLFGNVCLRDDVLQIENSTSQLNKIGTKTALACSDVDRQELENSLKYIFFAKKYLLEFGLTDETTEASVASGNDFKSAFIAKFGIAPPEQLGQIDTFTSKKYRDDESCKANSRYFSFVKLKQKIQSISAKLTEIKELFSDMKRISNHYFAGNRDPGIDAEWRNMVSNAKHSAEISAENWFARNIERPISSIVSIARSDQDVRAMTAERAWKINMLKRRYAASYIRSKKSLSDVLEEDREIISAYGALENSEDKWKNSKSFTDYIHDIAVDSQLLSPAISRQLETDVWGLPVAVSESNDHLDDTIDLLREACLRHAPCELPSS